MGKKPLVSVKYVAQYPDGTRYRDSIRTLQTKIQFLSEGPYSVLGKRSVSMKGEHFTFKMKVLASSKLAKQSQKTPFCSLE